MARLGLILVTLVLAVLSGLLTPSSVQAYGAANGAQHTYSCWSASASNYPSYGGCAPTLASIRDADMAFWVQLCNTANSTTYSCKFDHYQSCDPPGSGSCYAFYEKTLFSNGSKSLNLFSVGYQEIKRTDSDCAGAGYKKMPNGSCYCAVGYKPGPSATCVPAPTCPPAGTKVPGSDGYTFESTAGDSSYMGCFDGCLVAGAFGARSGGQSWVMGPLVNTGQWCNPSSQGGTYTGMGSSNSDPGQKPDSCPPPKCPGSVNGTSVCVACDTTTTGDFSKPSDGQNSGGKDTTTTCTGGVCTTTTKDVDQNGNTIPGGGSHTGTGGSNPNADGTGQGNGTGDGNCTGSDCQDQPSFCEDNPDSPICKDSNWGGTCESSFSCDGDEIQCAIAKEQHMRNCTLFVTHTDLSDKGTEATQGGDQPVGHPFKDAQATSIDFATRIDRSNLLSGSCPAGRTITVMERSIVLLTQEHCNSLAMLGDVLVGLTALACVGIVFK